MESKETSFASAGETVVEIFIRWVQDNIENQVGLMSPNFLWNPAMAWTCMKFMFVSCFRLDCQYVLMLCQLLWLFFATKDQRWSWEACWHAAADCSSGGASSAKGSYPGTKNISQTYAAILAIWPARHCKFWGRGMGFGFQIKPFETKFLAYTIWCSFHKDAKGVLTKRDLMICCPDNLEMIPCIFLKDLWSLRLGGRSSPLTLVRPRAQVMKLLVSFCRSWVATYKRARVGSWAMDWSLVNKNGCGVVLSQDFKIFMHHFLNLVCRSYIFSCSSRSHFEVAKDAAGARTTGRPLRVIPKVHWPGWRDQKCRAPRTLKRPWWILQERPPTEPFLQIPKIANFKLSKGLLAFEISELWTFCCPGCRFSTPPEKIGALDFSSSKIAGDRDLKIHSGQSPYNSTREDPWEKVWPLKVRRKNMCICHHLVAVAEMKRLETSSRFLAFKKNQSCHVIRPNKP